MVVIGIGIIIIIDRILRICFFSSFEIVLGKRFIVISSIVIIYSNCFFGIRGNIWNIIVILYLFVVKVGNIIIIIIDIISVDICWYFRRVIFIVVFVYMEFI